jgi:hypothetical protein
MKRKYGAARANESLAEQRMREAAKEMGDNSHNFGSMLKKGLAHPRQAPRPRLPHRQVALIGDGPQFPHSGN